MQVKQAGSEEAATVSAAASVVQCKLAIGSVKDPLEAEADEMADKVIQMQEPLSNSGRVSSQGESVQRTCSQCEEDEKVQRKPLTSFIQKKGGETGTVASDAVSSRIGSTKGSGNNMDSSTQSYMESRFDADFSNVKIHTGNDAVQMSNELNAQAFTVGSDIYFNSNRYNPSSNAGKHLLAHELTHTIQQEGNIGRKIQKRDMAFNPSVVAVQLRNAMEGLGTDEEAIYAAMAGRTAEQAAAIATAYLTLTGRQLQADLEDELTTGELLRLAQYGQVMGDTAENRATAVAMQLRDAMKGWGTDENAIYVALQGRGQAELALITTAYQTLTSRNLMDDLRDELTDDEMNMARSTMGMAPVVRETDTELGMLSMGNFDFNFNNCAIEIEVRVKFQFTNDIAEAGRNAFKPRFINAVHSKWQHSGYKLVGGSSCPCEDIPITVNVVENNSDYHKIVDVEDKTDRDRRPMVARDINVNLHTDDDTFMHEFGHVLGLYDEYDGGFFENIMFWHRNRPDDPGSLMNGLEPDGTENTEAGLRPRFFEHYQRTVNRTASFNCNYIITN